MLQAVLRGIRDVGLEDVPKPVIEKDTDAIVKVTAASICTSDTHYWEGALPIEEPIYLGHEIVGVVEEVGSAVKKFKPGDRISVAPYAYCGECELCKKGLNERCMNGALYGSGKGWGNLKGAMAEYGRLINVDGSCIHIPDEISDEQALMAGDAFTSGYHAVQLLELNNDPEKTVVVFGAGPIGLSAVQSAALQNPKKLILVDLIDDRLELGRRLGATHLINSTREDPVDRIRELTDGKGASGIIDLVGGGKVIDAAAKALEFGGTIALIGMPEPGDTKIPLQHMQINVTTIKTGVTKFHYMQEIMDLLVEGKITVDPYITHIMPLTDFNKGFELFRTHSDGVMKVIFKPHG